MSEHVYDRHAQFYLDFIDRDLASTSGYVALLLDTLVACLGDRLTGARVCDLCCGEGYAGRALVARGAREVVGVDLATALIEVACRRANHPALSYLVDDAQELASLADADFDVVVSQMAMMDVADHRRFFAAARRILRPGGAFAVSMLHPCFEGRPFHVQDAPPYQFDDTGAPLAFLVSRYASEGRWESGGTGVRGHMGSYHRTLSTLVNDLIGAGFTLERLEEPLAGADASRTSVFSEVPTALVVAARAS